MKDKAEDVIKQLLKSKHFKSGDSEDFGYERIKFNIPALDKLTGGGIPKKKFTLIYGPTNVGKSYLALQAVANAQKEGGTAAWIDTELSWDASWAERCGVDSKSVSVSEPEDGENALEAVKEAMQLGADVIVLDSIAGLVPSNVAEQGFDYNPMAWQARFINSSLPKLMPYLKNGSALIAINQVRAAMGPVAIDNMPGGIGQTFFAHFLLQVKRKGWIKEKVGKTEQNVGFDMEVRLRKSKVGGENWSTAIVPFRVDGGIDVIESYIREGIQTKLITQGGAWYTYKDTKEMGLNGIKKAFLENPALFEELKNELTA